MSDWSLDQARKTYSIPHWADGYFDVNDAGHVVVTPTSDGPSVSLPEVVDAARAAGAKLPLLVRFPDILGQRLGKLQAAFAQAQSEWDYAGGYTAVYPIKVNQHRGVAGTLASHHGDGFGLEAGSKPELMAVLALSRPGGLIVCNGYKDREYIRLALIGRKLGLQTFIVIEKPSELKLVLEEARALDVKPGLGVRMRLASLGAGKWQNSGGDKAKFGLSPRQVLDLWKTLRDTEYADSCSCCISTWARRFPMCATSPTACARPRAISWSCRGWAPGSAMWTSAAAWASITKARARAAIARSITACIPTPATSCSRWPAPAKSTA
ncbi:arginine decarboxylase [Xanthomonas arboricola pv. pruni str. MAFF 311562]|uniref:Arginine decarboxylase n=1 Tax=Xanthomonas arboricola pv. pruni str. MAFF 311562 TaxID=1414836 RepID=W4S479_9XANT|nr:arginine decarboxylase [Xanthomonas arboricola pv. pruni str. MAFF 311562]